MWPRQKQVFTIVVSCLFAFGFLLSIHSKIRSQATEDQPSSIKIALFPYVPDQKLIQSTIEKKWKAIHPNVAVVFVSGDEFDSYKQNPPSDLDVFEFDAIGLEYYVRNNFLSPLALKEVNQSQDIFDFAWKGSMVDGQIYGVPRLACTYVLIYRKDDSEIANASGLQQLYKVLGDGPSTLPPMKQEPEPEPNKGLLIDLSGGTDCACLYLDAFADVTGKYLVRPRLPNALELDTSGLTNLKLLAKMAGKPQATFAEPYGAPPRRPAWFGEGKGRVFVGYSERLYYIPKAVHDQLKVRDLPMAEKNSINNLFVDVLGINSGLRGNRRRLAIELANLCSSREVLLESLLPSGDKPSQYLLPVRPSVLKESTLLKNAPLYGDLARLMEANTNPQTYRIGPEYRDWLELNKQLIQTKLFK